MRNGGKMQTENVLAEGYCLSASMKSTDSASLVTEKLFTEHFTLKRHRIIFDLIKNLFLSNKEVTIHSVNALGMNLGVFNDLAYLYEITFDEHRTIELPTYIEILHDCKLSRDYVKTLKLGCDNVEKVTAVKEQINELMVNIEKLVSESEDSKITTLKESLEGPYKTSPLSFKEYVKEKIKLQSQGVKELTGLSTGFDNLDDATDGLQPAWLYVIGARPSEGKTQFLLNVMNNVAKQGHPCLFFSLEMPAADVMTELLSINGEYDHKKMKEGACTPIDLQKLHYSADLCEKLPIYIDDQASISTVQMKIRLKRMIRTHGIKAVFIDYLQEVNAVGKFGNHQEKMQVVSREIREMAKEFEIPIFCAAQVNRESEKNEKVTPPMAAHLRESGQIEQCAWFIGMLHRPDKYDPTNYPGILELYIRKNRFGIRKTLRFNHNPNSPAYSYKITEVKDTGDETARIRAANTSTTNDWNSFE